MVFKRGDIYEGRWQEVAWFLFVKCTAQNASYQRIGMGFRLHKGHDATRSDQHYTLQPSM